MKIQTAETAERKPWSILIYGLPKSGKTVFACGAPEPLLLEVDSDGEISLKNHPDLHQVPYILTPSFDSVVSAVQTIKKEKPGYKTLIIDTLSGLQEAQRLEEAGVTLSDKAWKMNEHIYTKNNFKINTLVRTLIELKDTLGMNIIFTVHLKEEVIGAQENRRVLLRPDLSPALLKAVSAHVNAFFALQQEGNERQLVVQGNKLLMANSRYKFDKSILKNPTFTDLLKYLEK